jgi:uncharacterized protein YjiS (DUF1127 family)
LQQQLLCGRSIRLSKVQQDATAFIEEDSSMGTHSNGIAHRIAQYRKYRETLNELGRLGDQELTDLGLNRTKIRDIAYSAAYGL